MAQSTVQFNLRMTPEMRAELHRIAQENRRTVTEEINERLRKSLTVDQADRVSHETPESRALVTVLHQAMVTAGDSGIFRLTDGEIGDLGKGKWLDDPYTFDCAVRAAVAVLEAFRPAGKPSRATEPPKSEMSPERVARKWLRVAAADFHFDESPEGKARVDWLRQNLGRLRERLPDREGKR